MTLIVLQCVEPFPSVPGKILGQNQQVEYILWAENSSCHLVFFIFLFICFFSLSFSCMLPLLIKLNDYSFKHVFMHIIHELSFSFIRRNFMTFYSICHLNIKLHVTFLVQVSSKSEDRCSAACFLQRHWTFIIHLFISPISSFTFASWLLRKKLSLTVLYFFMAMAFWNLIALTNHIGNM